MTLLCRKFFPAELSAIEDSRLPAGLTRSVEIDEEEEGED